LEEIWKPVGDFYKAGPADACFILDPQAGMLTFGDGVRGRIPVAGSQVVAARYRSGGGALGNTGPDTITSLKSPVLHVDTVSNLRAAAGGADAETLNEARLRAPHDLRHRDRAVTAEDFADLVLGTPGVKIQRAYALARTSVSTQIVNNEKKYTLVTGTPGAVTIVILPENKEDRPQPSEDQLQMVSQYLNHHRLITTELYVIGPQYLKLDKLEAEIFVSRQADLKSVQEKIQAALLTYFHPLKGGLDGKGWPFGRDVYFGEVYRQILAVQHVTRIQCLDIESTSVGSCTNGTPDFIPVADGCLVYLPTSSIQLKVRYDPYS
jgi:predicted phage baseplate assembly protein